MIKKIVSQRSFEFEVGQAAPSNTDWATVIKIERYRSPVPTGQPETEEYVVSLSDGEWISIQNPTEVWYAPDDVPAAGA